MKTFSARLDKVKRDWYVIDATDGVLGRLSSEIVRATGRKKTDKLYHRVTGYVGNIKSVSLERLLQQTPERVIQIAVKGMLPKNPLGRAMFRKLKVYAGPEHQHVAQQPKPLILARQAGWRIHQE